MLVTWFRSEAAWRHNRLHLVVALLSIAAGVGQPSWAALVIVGLVCGSLVVRIVRWRHVTSARRTSPA